MKKTLRLLLRLIPAAIMLQTLYFKFTAAPVSVHIFTQVGLEPLGRWGVGIAELIASVLILLPATQVIGGLLTVLLMSGAIMSHIFVLGVVVQNDGGALFSLAAVTLLCSLLHLYLNREKLKQVCLALRQKNKGF